MSDFPYLPWHPGVVAINLGLMNNEFGSDRTGGEVVSARLADVLLVEAVRAHAGTRVRTRSAD